MNRGLLVAAAIAVAGVAGGAAYATNAITNGGGDTIIGCADNQNGQLRIVNDASQCRQNEHAVTFAAPQGPRTVAVDCAAGQSINQVLADNANSEAPLTINIKGTCTESVSVGRDNVDLEGVSPGAGIQSPGNAPPLVLNRARYVRLNSLTLTGGFQALSANSGAQFNADDLHVTGAGISVGDNATGFVSNSTIENADNGASAAAGGVLTLAGTTIRSSQTGATAHEGGRLQLVNGTLVTDSASHGVVAESGGVVFLNNAHVANSGIFGVFAFGGSAHVSSNSLIEGSHFAGLAASDGGSAFLDQGARVAGNGDGLDGQNGGSLLIQDNAVVEGNTGDGVSLQTGSTLRMQFAVIRGNTGNGVHLRDTSVATFGPGASVENNGGWGLFCNGAPSVAMVSGPDPALSGNAVGASNCQNA